MEEEFEFLEHEVVEIDRKWLESINGREMIAALRSCEKGLLTPPQPILDYNFLVIPLHIVLKGNQKTGKTCLAANLCGDPIPDQYHETFGHEIREAYWPIKPREALRLMFHDTPRPITDPVDAEIYVFRTTDRFSVQAVTTMLASRNRQIPAIVVGTYHDLVQRSQVTAHECQTLATRYEVPVLRIANTGPSATLGAYSILNTLSEIVLRHRKALRYPPPAAPPAATS